VTGFVAEDNSGPTDRNGERSVLELELSIRIEKGCNPNPGSEGGPQTQIGDFGPKSHFGIGHFKTWVVMARWTRLDVLIPNLPVPT
jgi:hypothetical protein